MLPLYPDRVLTDSREAWRSYDHIVGTPSPERQHLFPDFLIIGAPKAGTSWLFSVLATHPEIFMPAEKELRYFNTNWKWLPIDDYLRLFEPGAGRKKGEATPYCALPSVAINTIKRLNPDIKILFLVRDPVDQAWSQMKHTFRYRGGTFLRYQCLFENLSLSNYLESFLDDASLASIDHYEILQRWMRVFPRENFWIASLEEIAADPEAVYRSALTFLGVSMPPSLGQAAFQNRVNEGLPNRLDTETATVLRSLHQPRALRFIDFAQREFGKNFAPLWRRTLNGETLAEPFPVVEDLYGWRVVLFAGKLWAYPKDAVHKIAATPNALKPTDPSTPLHAADFNYELQCKLGIIDQPAQTSAKTMDDVRGLEDARLERMVSCMPMVMVSFVVDEVEEAGDYFAARMIAGSSESTAASRPLSQQPVPGISGTDIVDTAPIYVGIRQDMWPPQPWMAPFLEQDGLPPVIFVADDRESLNQKLAPFVKSSGVPIIEGSYRGYNIIRLRHDVIAIKQTLGTIDLGRKLTQLAQQFDADDFMIDTDPSALRARIVETEGRRNMRAIFNDLHAQIERMKDEQSASISDLRRQLAAVQQDLSGTIRATPTRRALRAMRRLLGRD